MRLRYKFRRYCGPSNIENTETDINEPVENSGQAEDSDMLFNPDRVIGNMYQLVYRKDHKLCPQGVKKCEICTRAFVEEDIVVVKTVGERRFRKDGQEQRTRGDVPGATYQGERTRGNVPEERISPLLNKVLTRL